MVDYPYLNNTGRLKQFLEEIKPMGVPPSATTRWLPSIGFKSNNDRPIIKIMKFIGFVNSSNKPTEQWEAYKRNPETVLASCIRIGYSDLFQQYPRAHERSDEDLKNHFMYHRPSAGDNVIGLTVKTFKTLCSLADFESAEDDKAEPNSESAEPLEPHQAGLSLAPDTQSPSVPSFHINIEIHISADSSTEQIDNIFESMAKHLYSRGTV